MLLDNQARQLLENGHYYVSPAPHPSHRSTNLPLVSVFMDSQRLLWALKLPTTINGCFSRSTMLVKLSRVQPASASISSSLTTLNGMKRASSLMKGATPPCALSPALTSRFRAEKPFKEYG
ncbi:hypothetical protein ABEB36_015741 [Hypothenemus hampei]|uniref:Uncharacterized protein n=1 Tax=Hypothenemus hampei TaxID=57062 RepID=A0ABD1DZ39_HYPHA